MPTVMGPDPGEVLAVVTRGDVPEHIHTGHVVISDPDGLDRLAIGDRERMTPTRSCLKPFQALPLLIDGLDGTYRLEAAQVAVMAGSHAGQAVHQALVKGILDRIFLDEKALGCPSPRGAGTRLAHPCSGKHAGMLMYTVAHRGAVESYLDPESPAQQRVLTELLKLTRRIRSDVPVVIDGCGAPVACLPLFEMARLFALLAHPPSAPGLAAPALARLVSALRAHPECLEGDGLFDTELARSTAGRVIAKIGAGGVACAALADLRLGVAVKIESGSLEIARAVLARVLGNLGVLPDTVADRMAALAAKPPTTPSGRPCGSVRILEGFQR